MTEHTTEQQFFAEYDRMKADLTHARQEILLLSNQLRDSNAEQEKLAFKCDFLTKEVARVTASREQYERVAIRITAMMDGALDSHIALSQKMKDEIRDAAFTKVPGSPKPPEPPAEPEEPSVDVEKIAQTFGAGFGAEHVTTLPAPRFGNGPQTH